jgi:sodium/hydrogen antiporter
MSEYPIIVFTALLILGYGVFSRLSERSIITAPMVFVLVGMLASSFPVDFLREGINAPIVKIVAEITLVLVLFVDASTINLKALIKEKGLPIRLLFIGLPITMVLGILIGIPMFKGMDIWLIALMALILSPTDAALGQAVVTSKFVPEKIRQSINVESGLNDGIALPPILICLAALSESSSHGSGFSYWGLFTLKQFVFGPAIGGLVGWVGGKIVEKASDKGWMNQTFQRLASIALAILAFSLAELVHGNGFIAAFFAGMLLGTTTSAIRDRIQEFGEAEAQALVLFVFLIFGMILFPIARNYWDLNAWIYAILSLTVIRMLPVWLCLRGTKLPLGTVAFIGWFGPRGIASVLYLIMALMAMGLTGHEVVFSVIVLTVLLSIFLHGISAMPLSQLYKSK